MLGKPPIDRVLIRFIPDSNTIVANLLSRTVDVWFNPSIGFPQAQALDQSGWDGTVSYPAQSPRIVEFQQRDWGHPQRAGMDVHVRRAALHAIDRAAIVDNIFAGKGRVAYFWLPQSDPSFPAIDRGIRKYEYDATRAETLLRDAGWVKSGDGISRNAAGEPLDLPMQNQPNDIFQWRPLCSGSNEPLAQWGSLGVAPGQFAFASGVAVDAQGNLFVIESFTDRMQKLSPQGEPSLNGAQPATPQGSSSYRTGSPWTPKETSSSPTPATTGSRSSPLRACPSRNGAPGAPRRGSSSYRTASPWTPKESSSSPTPATTGSRSCPLHHNSSVCVLPLGRGNDVRRG